MWSVNRWREEEQRVTWEEGDLEDVRGCKGSESSLIVDG